MSAETTDVPETPVTPDPAVALNPEQLLQSKIQEASKKVNDYLEAAGLELRVIHTISLVPKQTPKI